MNTAIYTIYTFLRKSYLRIKIYANALITAYYSIGFRKAEEEEEKAEEIYSLGIEKKRYMCAHTYTRARTYMYTYIHTYIHIYKHIVYIYI